MIIIVCFIIIAIISWFTIDYHLGRKDHLSKSKYKEYMPKRSTIELFNDGVNLYRDLFESIKQSKHSIHILFYIVRNDEISQEFLSLLEEKALQGIEVRFMLDFMGSHKFSRKKIKELKEKGIIFSFSHKPRFPYLFYTLQARNHRKITVVDGKIAYLGGFNIAKEYIGKDPKFGYWRDYHLKITGEGVADLQEQFLKDWYDATGYFHLNDSIYFPVLPTGKSPHVFLSTYGENLGKHFKNFIREAKQEIIICTPYFIPGKQLLNELLKAIDRGVKVKVLVPMRKDHPFVKEASFPYFGPLLAAGCDIYQFYYGFYHAKVMVIDDFLCDIGTANFDKRSLYLNDEMNCLIYDKVFISQVKSLIYEDFRRSEQLTYETYKNRSLVQRSKEMVSTLISHFL